MHQFYHVLLGALVFCAGAVFEKLHNYHHRGQR